MSLDQLMEHIRERGDEQPAPLTFWAGLCVGVVVGILVTCAVVVAALGAQAGGP